MKDLEQQKEENLHSVKPLSLQACLLQLMEPTLVWGGRQAL